MRTFVSSLCLVLSTLAGCVQPSGGGGDSTPDGGIDDDAGPLECAFGEVACWDECSDLVTDAYHCGTCGAACAAGEACVAGECRAGAQCGNGVCEEPEVAATCAKDCAPPVEVEVESNDSCGTAQVIAPWSSRIAGTFESGTDYDWYEITHEADGDLEVFTNDVTGDACGRTSDAGSDTVLDLYAADCSTVLAHSDDDAAASTYCSRFRSAALPAGTYVLRARAVSVGTDPAYEIELAR